MVQTGFIRAFGLLLGFSASYAAAENSYCGDVFSQLAIDQADRYGIPEVTSNALLSTPSPERDEFVKTTKLAHFVHGYPQFFTALAAEPSSSVKQVLALGAASGGWPRTRPADIQDEIEAAIAQSPRPSGAELRDRLADRVLERFADVDAKWNARAVAEVIEQSKQQFLQARELAQRLVSTPAQSTDPGRVRVRGPYLEFAAGVRDAQLRLKMESVLSKAAQEGVAGLGKTSSLNGSTLREVKIFIKPGARLYYKVFDGLVYFFGADYKPKEGSDTYVGLRKAEEELLRFESERRRRDS